MCIRDSAWTLDVAEMFTDADGDALTYTATVNGVAQTLNGSTLRDVYKRQPYIYVDGIYLRRNWGGEYENVAILVAIAVNEDGFRQVLGAAEGMKEDKASWVNFFQWLRGRGLDGVKLIVGDKCMGMLEAVGEVFPDAKYQRCTVHFLSLIHI